MAELFTPKIDADSFRAVKKLLAEGKTYKQIQNKTKLGLTTIQAIKQTDSLAHYQDNLRSRNKIRKLQQKVAGNAAIVRRTEKVVRDQERENRKGLLVELAQEQKDNTTLAKAALIGYGLAVVFLVAGIVAFVLK